MLVKMKEELKVSIIIPVYNVEQYIGNCLRSVMRQTYKGPMECLIIDDCGTDDSIAIAEGVIREYNDNANVNLNANLDLEVNATLDFIGGGGIRFEILHHERNRGLSAARNTGTEAATGDYILYIDSAQSETYRHAAKIIKNTLSFKDAPFRYMLLYTTGILSKFRIGRLIFYTGSRLYGIIRSI